MKQFNLDKFEHKVVRRCNDNISALVSSCPIAYSYLNYLVSTEIERQRKEGVKCPDAIRIMQLALKVLDEGAYRYRIVSSAAMNPVQYCTDNYSDMLNVLSVLQQENKDIDYQCFTWSEKQNEYVKA